VIRRAHAASPALLGARRPWCWPVAVIMTVALVRGAHAQPAASATPPSAPDIADELARLEGQRVRVLDQGTPDDRGYVPGYVIEDVAGEGAPVIGVVERRGQALWLVAADGASYRLAGVLARPRIAGPGYKIWVLGTVTAGGGERILVARRLGVLAPPWRRAQARGARRTIFAISAGAPTRTGGPQ
jgi:hypothetical protein